MGPGLRAPRRRHEAEENRRPGPNSHGGHGRRPWCRQTLDSTGLTNPSPTTIFPSTSSV